MAGANCKYLFFTPFLAIAIAIFDTQNFGNKKWFDFGLSLLIVGPHVLITPMNL